MLILMIFSNNLVVLVIQVDLVNNTNKILTKEITTISKDKISMKVQKKILQN